MPRKCSSWGICSLLRVALQVNHTSILFANTIPANQTSIKLILCTCQCNDRQKMFIYWYLPGKECFEFQCGYCGRDMTCTNYPNTVINNVISSRINHIPDSMHKINKTCTCYSAPSLFVQILTCKTVRSNQKGFNALIMDLPKTSPWGISLPKGPVINVLFGQWSNTKAVLFISMLGILGWLQFSMMSVLIR